LGDGQFDRLLLREVWRVEFILLLQGALLVVIEVGGVLLVEEIDVS
jgi:hypothetical protein